MQMICDIPLLFGKWNYHANFTYTSHILLITQSSVIVILCHTIRELFKFDCHHIYINKCSHYIEKHTIPFKTLHKIYSIGLMQSEKTSLMTTPKCLGTQIFRWTLRYAPQDLSDEVTNIRCEMWSTQITFQIYPPHETVSERLWSVHWSMLSMTAHSKQTAELGQVFRWSAQPGQDKPPPSTCHMKWQM